MGSKNGLGFREYCGKEKGLELHLQTQFYPPHPKYVIEETIEAFKQYWDGKINETKLSEKCYLNSLDGLYKYYWMFLEDDGDPDYQHEGDIVDNDYDEYDEVDYE